MSKLEQYSRDLEFCLANAKRAFSGTCAPSGKPLPTATLFLSSWNRIRPAGRPKPITLTA